MKKIFILGLVYMSLAALAFYSIQAYDDAPDDASWTDLSISKTRSEISRLEKELAQESSPDRLHQLQLEVRTAKGRKRDLEQFKEGLKIAEGNGIPAERRGGKEIIVRTSGNVEMQIDGVWQPAKTGFPIKSGDALRTGADGLAVLWYDSGFAYVDKHSEMAFPKECLMLNSGFCHWDSVRKHAVNGQCDLATPDTMIIAKGTEFDIGFDSKRGTRYSAYSGTVELKSTKTSPGLQPARLESLPESAAARVEEFKGPVHIQLKDQSKWTAARAKATLAVGDKIKTGPEGHATLELRSGYKITMQPGSSFEVQSLDSEGPVYKLWSGMMRFWRAHSGLGARPQVRTPSAVAAIRGTDFELEIDPDTQVSTIVPRDGTVEITGQKENLKLRHRHIWWDK